MHNQEIVVPPLSRYDIRNIAKKFRERFGKGDKLFFPIVEVMEILAYYGKNFNLEYVPVNEMKNFHGLTLPDGTIKIREDVYERAANGNGMDRDTMAHELGHWLLHRGNKAHPKLSGDKVPVYMSPEWQAKAFSGELLVPYDLIRPDMSEYDVANMCGVSISAARYQLSKIPR